MINNSGLKALLNAVTELYEQLPRTGGGAAVEQARKDLEAVMLELEKANEEKPPSEAAARAAVMRTRNVVQAIRMIKPQATPAVEDITEKADRLQERGHNSPRQRKRRSNDLPPETAPVIEITVGPDGRPVHVILKYEIPIRPSQRDQELLSVLLEDPARGKTVAEIHAAIGDDGAPITSIKHFINRARSRGLPIKTSPNDRGEATYRLHGTVVYKTDQA